MAAWVADHWTTIELEAEGNPSQTMSEKWMPEALHINYS
jgi:hypothetical protein